MGERNGDIVDGDETSDEYVACSIEKYWWWEFSLEHTLIQYMKWSHPDQAQQIQIFSPEAAINCPDRICLQKSLVHSIPRKRLII